MPIKLANNASGTLATAVSASDTGFALTTGDGAEFPTLSAGDYFYATITSSGGTQEIVKATARSGDSLTVVRAQESTTAQSFAAGSRFELRVTAASVDDLVEEVRTELAASSGSSLIGFLQAGTGAVARTAQSKMREVVSVFDYGADPTGVSDSTSAIQAALDSGAGSVYLPEGTYLFSTLTVNKNTRLHGASTRTSILKHTGAATAIQCIYSGSEPDGRGTYISEGWFIFEDFELMANGTFGFRVGKTRSSFSMFNRLYIRHRRDLESGAGYFAGSIAIDCDNNPWTSSDATYLSKVHHCSIRGFEAAVNLNATVNGWEINRLWTIECYKQIVLSAATGISTIDSYFESGVAGATGFVFLGGGGNQINIIGTSFELTNAAATQYAYNFVGGTWETITVVGAKYLIQGDGNAVNNKRITGTIPTSFVELNRTYTSGTYGTIPMLWAPGCSTTKPFQLPNYSRLGGIVGGNGRLLLGRNGEEASDGYIENDGAFGLTFVAPSNGSVVDFNWKANDGTLHLKYQGYTNPQFSPGSDNAISLGTAAKRWSTVYSANVKLTPTAVASLPSAATLGAGAKAFVSDSNATTFAAIVVGGGANTVPVYSDGTNWRIG